MPRIDKLLIDRGLAPSQKKAVAMILAGQVFVGTQRVMNPSQVFPEEARIQMKGKDHPYVSRGGVKLAGALDHFKIDVSGRICLDVGVSTGGFTDCLLQRGAKKVYAVDVGYGQLAWSLRQESRVVVLERQNIRYLDPSVFQEPVEFVVVDVSFISLQKIFPCLSQILKNPYEVLALVKPQFELEKKLVPKGGVVREADLHQRALNEVREGIQKDKGNVVGTAPSCLPGMDGNQEYFIFSIYDKMN